MPSWQGFVPFVPVIPKSTGKLFKQASCRTRKVCLHESWSKTTSSTPSESTVRVDLHRCWVLFNEFIRSSRRDASACQHATYDEQVCKRARAAAASRECFNILSGGHVSPAAYCQMKRVAMVSCPCCQVEDAVPTLQHLLVDCPYFDAFRQQCFPGGVPGFDPIEIRLGWPLNPTHAESLLALHVHIRRHTLQLRWGS